MRERSVDQEKLIIKTDIQNHIETRVETVDRYEDKIVPVTSCVEKIV